MQVGRLDKPRTKNTCSKWYGQYAKSYLCRLLGRVRVRVLGTAIVRVVGLRLVDIETCPCHRIKWSFNFCMHSVEYFVDTTFALTAAFTPSEAPLYNFVYLLSFSGIARNTIPNSLSSLNCSITVGTWARYCQGSTAVPLAVPKKSCFCQLSFWHGCYIRQNLSSCHHVQRMAVYLWSEGRASDSSGKGRNTSISP